MQNEVVKQNVNLLVHTILKAVALAMGIGVAVLSVLNQIDAHSEFGMLGIGLACLALDSMIKKSVNKFLCGNIGASWTRRISCSGFLIFV